MKWEVGDLGVKKCGRWEIGGQKLWEVGDWHPCVTPPPPPPPPTCTIMKGGKIRMQTTAWVSEIRGYIEQP